mmetsp:Transcript_60085/g.135490  ORF Transcript_60085/g.135490 Transcript_60085/m.135490 type:complete len:254 (+) Transcript_60085:145-906(+)
MVGDQVTPGNSRAIRAWKSSIDRLSIPMSMSMVSFSSSSTSNMSLTITWSLRASTSTVGPEYSSCTATWESAPMSAGPSSSGIAMNCCLGPAFRSLMYPMTSLASASPSLSPNFWMSSRPCAAASCALSRLLPRKCAHAARTSMRPSSFSSWFSWQSATASLTTFMPSSSFMPTRWFCASTYIESMTSRLSPTFFASARASLAASRALSLSFPVFFCAAPESSFFIISSMSAVSRRICTTPTLSPSSCASTRA